MIMLCRLSNERQTNSPVPPGISLTKLLQCESKNPPGVFRHFFPNVWEFLVQILHAYYMFLSTLDFKFLFNYLQL